MYMSLMVTNCSGERSFSKMSLRPRPTKNKLRNKMTDARLNALELLSLESDLRMKFHSRLSLNNLLQSLVKKLLHSMHRLTEAVC